LLLLHEMILCHFTTILRILWFIYLMIKPNRNIIFSLDRSRECWFCQSSPSVESHLPALVNGERHVIFDITQMQGSTVWEVLVLFFWTRENVKRVQTAALDTAYRMKVISFLPGSLDQKIQGLTDERYYYVLLCLWIRLATRS
jgi:hypothetical protein